MKLTKPNNNFSFQGQVVVPCGGNVRPRFPTGKQAISNEAESPAFRRGEYVKIQKCFIWRKIKWKQILKKMPDSGCGLTQVR